MPKTMKKPINHAEGKPVRGVRGPGVRGPNKTREELERPGVIIVKEASPPKPRSQAQLAHDAQLQKISPRIAGPNSRGNRLARQLQELIRMVGDETLDQQKGWTRIEAVVRRLYADAMSGKTSAQALLFERGWGRVPAPITVDMRTEILQIMDATGLTQDELTGDPVLSGIFGQVIENNGQPPRFDDASEQPE